MLYRNVASQKWIVFAFNETDNTPVTGDAANITGKISQDGAAGTAIGDTNPTELEDGYYAFDLTQAETNANLLLILPESSTANVSVVGVPGTILPRTDVSAFGTADSGSTTTIVDAARTEADDYWNGAIIHFLSGTVAGQSRLITDFVASTDTITFTPALTAAASTNDYEIRPWFTYATGDAFARLGAPAGASVSADIATVDTVVDGIQTDLDNGTDGLGAIKADTAAILVDTADMQPKLGTVQDLGGGATIAANLDDMAGSTFSSASDSLEAIRDRGDAAWTTGSGTGLTALASGTAQGGTSSTIQLASGETFADDEPNGNIINITGGTGAGQSRVITDYTGSTDTATVSPNWTTTPDATSTYEMVQGSSNITTVSNAAEDLPTATALATVDSNVDAILVDTADMQPKLGTVSNLGGGATLADNLSDMAGATFSTTTDTLEAIRDRGDAAWTTGSGTGLTALASGTAQGGTSTTIQLASGESFADDEPNGNVINLTGGTGAGQSRVIIDYTGSTDTATVTPAWTTTPDATTTYEMIQGSTNITAVSNAAEDIATATALATVDTVVDGIQTDLDNGTDGLGAIKTAVDAVPDAATIADAVWDETLTGSNHNLTNSAGRRLRQVDQAFIITEGTAQAGTASTITLAAGESSTNDIFRGDRVQIIAGTGVGEHGLITSYNGTTKVATMSENWVIIPDNTSEYILVPADVDVETWQHSVVSVSATTNKPEVDIASVSDDSTAADNLESMYDGTGYNASNSTVGTVTTLTGHTAQTGDNYARLGVPAGASISADIATIDTVVDGIQTDLDNGTDGLGAIKTAIDTVDTNVDAILVDTAELQGDWTDGGRLDLLIDAIKVVTDALGSTAAANLALSAGQMITFTVDTATNSHTPTTTEFQADDITEATADHYNGRIVIFTSGALAGQATDITDYEAVGGIGQLTVTALTEAPTNNDTGIIV